MAISPFVRQDDRIEVEVYIFQINGVISAVSSKDDVPKEVTDTETAIFTFRRMSYSDSRQVMRFAPGMDRSNIDLSGFQDELLRRLLVEWSFKDENGESIPVNSRNIDKLVPAIASAAVAGLMEQTAV